MKNNRLFKVLFSSALAMFVSCGGFMYGDTVPTDTKQVPPQTGTTPSVQVLPDGTKVIMDAEGSTVHLNPDGSKTIMKKDGTTVQVKPDGSKVIKQADGTTVEVKPGQTMH